MESVFQPHFSALERHRKRPNGRLAAEWCAFSNTGNQFFVTFVLKFQGPNISFSGLVLGLQKPLFRSSLGASRALPWGQNWFPSAAKCSFSLPTKAPKKSSEKAPFRALPGGYRGAPGPILKSILGLPENCKNMHPSHTKRDSPTQNSVQDCPKTGLRIPKMRLRKTKKSKNENA